MRNKPIMDKIPKDYFPPFYDEEDFEDDELDYVYDLIKQFLYERIPFTNLCMLMEIILNDDDAALSCRTYLTMHRVNVEKDPQKFN